MIVRVGAAALPLGQLGSTQATYLERACSNMPPEYQPTKTVQLYGRVGYQPTAARRLAAASGGSLDASASVMSPFWWQCTSKGYVHMGGLRSLDKSHDHSCCARENTTVSSTALPSSCQRFSVLRQKGRCREDFADWCSVEGFNSRRRTAMDENRIAHRHRHALGETEDTTRAVYS